jgi:hypothetical protein
VLRRVAAATRLPAVARMPVAKARELATILAGWSAAGLDLGVSGREERLSVSCLSAVRLRAGQDAAAWMALWPRAGAD